jgi:hypothetical protein
VRSELKGEIREAIKERKQRTRKREKEILFRRRKKKTIKRIEIRKLEKTKGKTDVRNKSQRDRPI